MPESYRAIVPRTAFRFRPARQLGPSRARSLWGRVCVPADSLRLGPCRVRRVARVVGVDYLSFCVVSVNVVAGCLRSSELETDRALRSRPLLLWEILSKPEYSPYWIDRARGA